MCGSSGPGNEDHCWNRVTAGWKCAHNRAGRKLERPNATCAVLRCNSLYMPVEIRNEVRTAQNNGRPAAAPLGGRDSDPKRQGQAAQHAACCPAMPFHSETAPSQMTTAETANKLARRISPPAVPKSNASKASQHSSF